MMHPAKTLAAAFVALGLAAAPAIAADPTGTWQTTGGESRYNVSYCGDGTQLCAKLTWLRKDARTAENIAYLNKFVVKGAKAVDEDEWKGRVVYDGDTFNGQMRLAGDRITLKGCKGVFCKSMGLVRL
jgi:uncharacterized protein (DUF2147 family)